MSSMFHIGTIPMVQSSQGFVTADDASGVNTGIRVTIIDPDISLTDFSVSDDRFELVADGSQRAFLKLKVGQSLCEETSVNIIYAYAFHTYEGTTGYIEMPLSFTISMYTDGDFIHGYSGDDTLNGGAGDDKMYGVEGDDTLSGGAGDDNIIGGLGDDTIYGGVGDDRLDGDGTTYDISEGGDDTLYGGDGDDDLFGHAGDDTLYGGDGDDYLSGNIGDDMLYGDAGDDRLSGWRGNDHLYGGDGDDILYSGEGDDRLYGNAGDDTLYGGEGDDWLIGALGDDTLYGGAGKDWLLGGVGADIFVLGTGGDTVVDFNPSHIPVNLGGISFSGDGDKIRIDSFTGTMPATVESLLTATNLRVVKGHISVGDVTYSTADDATTENTAIYRGNTLRMVLEDFDDDLTLDMFDLPNATTNIIGTPGDDTLNGGSDDDTIRGRGGDDTIDGGDGDDDIRGGAGDDTIDGGSGDDEIRGRGGDDTIDGGSGDDELRGNRGDDAISGSGGDDDLHGGKGDDTIYGDEGNDILRGKAGDDTLYGGRGDDTFYGKAGDDTLYGGAGDDELRGGKGDDILYGGSGDDTLSGGKGADIFVLNTDATGTDTITDFNANDGDKIRVETFAGTMPRTVEAFLTAANLRVVKGHISVDGLNSTTDKASKQNTAIYRGDTLLMVLEDFDADLTLDMFDLPNATAIPTNNAPTFAQDSYSATIVETAGTGSASIGRVLVAVQASDADAGDTLTYSITAGNDARLFAINEDGEITLAVPDVRTNPATHTLMVTATDGVGNSDTATVTITDSSIRGTDDEESMTGGNEQDFIYGYGGDDVLYGGDGDDYLSGGDDDDTLYGGEGNDYVGGGRGDDILYGADGNDRISGYYGDDTLYGGDGDDVLYGGHDDDTLYGGAGDDRLDGGYDRDTLYGGAGNDYLYGNYGYDILIGGVGNNILRGGRDVDIFVLNTDASGVDTVVDFYGIDYGGWWVGTSRIRVYVDDATETDTLEELYAAANIREEQGHIQVEGQNSSYDDETKTNTAIYKIVGEADSAENGKTDDVLIMVLEDVYRPLTRDDFEVVEGKYSDGTPNQAPTFAQETYTATIARGAESGDIITNIAATDPEGDTLTYSITAGNDAGLFIVDATNGDIKLATPDTRTDAGDHTLTLTVTDSAGNTATATVTITDYAIRGTDGDDLHTANGLYGDDEGDDTIYGNAGDDHIRGGAGDDTLYGGAGDDRVFGDGGDDTIYGGAGDDHIFAEGGNDTLYGGRGDDYVSGGDGGTNLLYGGAGADLFEVGVRFVGTDIVVDFNAEDDDHLELFIYADGNFDASSLEALLVSGGFRLDTSGNKIIEGYESGENDADIHDTVIYYEGHKGETVIAVLEDFTDLTYDMFNLKIYDFGDDDNTIRGTAEVSNHISGGHGDDTLYGGSGEDRLNGGFGDDHIYGGAGYDRIQGSVGDDTLYGGDGDDRFWGSTGDDILYGGADNDWLYGGDGDDTLYGGDGDDILVGDAYGRDGGADIFALNADDAGVDIVRGFAPSDGDKIRVDAFTGTIPATIEAFFTTANLRVEKGHIARPNYDSQRDDESIENTAIYSGDTLLMVLEDFTDDLTLDMFDLPNADTNNAPTFAQNSYTATIAQGAEAGDIITNIAATDADSDTLTYSITAGNDAGLFIVDATNGDIKLAAPDTKTDAGDHTITITATDTAGNSATATVTITDYAIRGTDGEDSMTGSDETDFIYGYGGDDTLNGGAGEDWIDGYDGDDMLYGGDDADAIWGGGGADTLYGGAGDDWLFGEGGDDRLYGGDGGDVLYGNEGDDRLSGDAGGDWLYGQDGDDRLYGNDGDDWIAGHSGDDTLSGGAGDDTLRGDSGGDDLHGGAGDDYLTGDVGDDTLYGGAGDDTLHGGSASDVLYGDAGADTLNGSYGGDVIYGGVDNDILNGGAGDDLLEGSAGNDTLYGGAGSDYLRGDSLALIGTEIFTGPADADIFVLNTADSGTDTITDFTPSDGDKIRIEEFTGAIPATVEAFLTAANLRVEKGHIKVDAWANINIPTDDNAITNTAIYSGDRLVMVLEDFTENLTLDMFDLPNAITNTAPVFTQTSYTETIAWTPRTDIVRTVAVVSATDADGDTLTYAITAGNDAGLFDIDGQGNITLAVPDEPTDATDHTLTVTATDTAGNTATATVTITDFAIRGTDDGETITGSDERDVIYGYGGDDTLYGGDGNDLIHGTAGDDIIYGGAGRDILVGGNNNDYLYGGAGDDELRGGYGDDTLDGGAGDDKLYGGGGDDTLYGGEGNDALAGHEGDDTLDGGEGVDGLYGWSGDDTLYGGAGDDYLVGGAGADIFVLGSGDDTVRDFTPSDGDKIRVADFTGVMPRGIEAFLTAANLRVEKGHIQIDELFNDNYRHIYLGHDSDTTENTAIYKGDKLLMVLEDFDADLTLDMFDLPNATPNTAPVFTQTSYTATLAETAAIGSAVIAMQAADVDAGDTLTYSITGGDGLFAINNDGEITLTGALDYETATSHTLTVQVEDSGGLTTATTTEVTINVTDVTEPNIIRGTDEGDRGSTRLIGTDDADAIYGLGGHDDILGNAGDDTLYGGSGDDKLSGGDGNDVIYGGSGRDGLYDYFGGINLFHGGLDADFFFFAVGSDHASNDVSTNIIVDFNTEDGDAIGLRGLRISGTFEVSSLEELASTAGLRFDTSGNKVIKGHESGENDADINDMVIYKGDAVVAVLEDFTDLTLDMIYLVVTGSDDDDIIYGGDGGNQIEGKGGDDKIYGGARKDYLYGFSGDDTIYGGASDDHIQGMDGDDTLYGGDGDDSLVGGSGTNQLNGGAGNDYLVGGSGIDQLNGGAGNDALHGNDGDDVLYGGAGDDALNGQGGADIFVLDADDAGVDIVRDFTPSDGDNSDGDKIRVAEFDGVIPGSIEAFLTAANLRVEKGHITRPNHDSYRDSETIENTAIYSGDTLVMVLEDFTADLTLDMFDLPNATPNTAPVFTQTSYTATLAETAAIGSAVIAMQATDADAGDTLTYSITGGDGLFAINNDGEITLTGALDYETATTHTITVQAQDSANATDTTEITINVTNTIFRGWDGSDAVDLRFRDDYKWDTIYGLGGDDRLLGGTRADTIYGGAGDDEIGGYGGDDRLYGGEGDDYIRGWAGDDKIYGGAGDDRLYGQTGRDLLKGGAGKDLFIVSAYPETNTAADSDVIVDLSIAEGERLELLVKPDDQGVFRISSFEDFETAHGVRFDTSGNKIIEGHESGENDADINDTVIYRGDVIVAVIEDAHITFDMIDWEVIGGADADTLYGGEGDDLVLSMGGNDALYGLGGDDILSGGDGDDFLDGGSGQNVLMGKDGADTFVLNLDGSSTTTISDFGRGNDKISLVIDELTISALNRLFSNDLRVERAHTSMEGFVDPYDRDSIENTIIYKVVGEADSTTNGESDDVLLVVLQDFDDALTYQMFGLSAGGDIVLTATNQAPTFTQNSYTATIARGAEIGSTVATATASDADGDALTYAITAGNDAGLFDIDEDSGEITLTVPDTETDAGDHTLTITATDTAGNTGTATVTITDYAIRGTDSHDRIDRRGTDGADTIYGYDGQDHLHGERGDDVLYGGGSADKLYGSAGDDILYGGAGSDKLDGSSGTDILYGGGDADVFNVNVDHSNSSAGISIVVDFNVAEGDRIRLDHLQVDGTFQISSFEDLESAFGLRFDTSDNKIIEGYESGENDADINDTVIYHNNTMLMVVEDSIDITLDMIDLHIVGGEGDDTIYGGEGADYIDSGAGADIIDGGAGYDEIRGGAGDDTLYGGDGLDRLIGGDGDDILDGGAGTDFLDGGAGADIFVLNTDDLLGRDILVGFDADAGDKIRVHVDNSGITTLEGLLTDAGLRIGYHTFHGISLSLRATIYKVVDDADDAYLMTLLSKTTSTLTFDMFDVVVNEPANQAPEFAQDSYTATLAENAESGSAVVTVQATDADAGDTLTYSIVSNNIPGLFVEDTIIDNAPPFAIDANTGAITLTGALDFETATTHTFTIQVEDSAGLTDTAEITINVTDSAIRGTDDDDRIGGTADADTIYGYGGDDFIYAQFGADTLYGGTGNDVLHGSGDNDTLYGGAGDDTLDGGAGLDTHYGGEGDDEFALDIHGLLQGHITDDSHADTLKDFGNGNDKIHIHVPASVVPSLDVTISSLEQLYSIFNLRVEKGHIAVDGLAGNIDDTAIENTAIYSGDVLLMVLEDFTADLTLNMFDLSHGIINRAPEFAQKSYTTTLAETAETGSAVVTVAATDADIDDTLTYSIIGGDGGGDGLFAINDDGEITLTGALDFETATSHNLTIKAQDKNGDTDTAKVVVHVTDANDNAPIFDAATHSVEIPELTEIGTTLTTVTARDADTSGVRYSILGGRNANLFSINENTGAITLKGFLDFETAESHRLVVQASDGVSTDTINVIIGVVDEMDCACLDIAANTEEIAAGTVLTASITHDDPNGYEGGKAPESGWVWFYQSKPDQEIGDGTSTYTVREEDSGEQICVRITYMDGNGRPEIVQARLEEVVQRVVIKPDAEDADKDKTYTAEADKATKVEAGTGADHVRDGNRNDVIDGGKGDDEIDLSASKEDNDVVIYGIGNQMASDGSDSITSFVRGRDKFVFQLKQSDIDAGNIDLSQDDGYEGFINYVTKGTEDLIDDQFWVNFNFSIGENGVQMDGISFHFKDSTFFSGGRISMPIVSIEFADPLSVDEVREVYSGRDKSTPLVKQGLLSDFDYLDDFLGGDGAIGFEII